MRENVLGNKVFGDCAHIMGISILDYARVITIVYITRLTISQYIPCTHKLKAQHFYLSKSKTVKSTGPLKLRSIALHAFYFSDLP